MIPLGADIVTSRAGGGADEPCPLTPRRTAEARPLKSWFPTVPGITKYVSGRATSQTMEMARAEAKGKLIDGSGEEEGEEEGEEGEEEEEEEEDGE